MTAFKCHWLRLLTCLTELSFHAPMPVKLSKEKLYQMSFQRLYNYYLASTIVFYADRYSSYTVDFVLPISLSDLKSAARQNNWIQIMCVFVLGFRWEARFSLLCVFVRVSNKLYFGVKGSELQENFVSCIITGLLVLWTCQYHYKNKSTDALVFLYATKILLKLRILVPFASYLPQP